MLNDQIETEYHEGTHGFCQSHSNIMTGIKLPFLLIRKMLLCRV